MTGMMRDEKLRLEKQRRIAPNVYEAILSGEEDFSDRIAAGQFVNLKIDGFFLRRPISVCDRDGERLTVIYKAVVEGTERMSRMAVGDRLDLAVRAESDRTLGVRAEAARKGLAAVDAAAAIGAKYLVVHADEYRLAPGEIYDSEKVVRNQIELFLPVAERAARAGIQLACENVTQSHDDPRSRCSCSSFFSSSSSFVCSEAAF